MPYKHTGIIKDCTNSANIYSSGNMGGITAYSGGKNGSLINCSNSGKITMNWIGDDQSIGGIVGIFEHGEMEECINCGDIYFETSISTLQANVKLGRVIGTYIFGSSTSYDISNDGSASTIYSGKLHGTFDQDICYARPALNI